MSNKKITDAITISVDPDEATNQPIKSEQLHPRAKRIRRTKQPKPPPDVKEAPVFPFDVRDDFENIKFYRNVPENKEEYFRGRISALKEILGDDIIFTPLASTTITVEGGFRMANGEFRFTESNFTSLLTEPTGNIISISSNYCKIMNPNYVVPKKEQKSTRGRKPKQKPKSERKKQGNGSEFQTQISFDIENPTLKRSYKIKLFRNGKFQIPGGRNPNLEDFMPPLIELRDYLKPIMGDIEIDRILAVMRNYKCQLINHDHYIDIIEMQQCVAHEKKPSVDYPPNIVKHEISPEAQAVLKEMSEKNYMNIAINNYNPDKCFPYTITFDRAFQGSKKNSRNQTSVKPLKSGKIDIEGAKCEEEVLEIWYWLQIIFRKYHSRILFDITTIKNVEDDDTSSYSGDEIYDKSVEDVQSTATNIEPCYEDFEVFEDC